LYNPSLSKSLSCLVAAAFDENQQLPVEKSGATPKIARTHCGVAAWRRPMGSTGDGQAAGAGRVPARFDTVAKLRGEAVKRVFLGA
jgi:hypothetical protein